MPEAAMNRRAQGECRLHSVRLSLGNQGPTAKLKRARGARAENKDKGARGQAARGWKRGGREIRGREAIRFKANAQRQPKLQQPVCMGLLTGYEGTSWFDCQGSGWITGTLMH